MKKLFNILGGVIAALVVILHINKLIQVVFALMLGVRHIFSSDLFLHIQILPGRKNVFAAVFVFLLPLLATIIFIESALIILGRKRSSSFEIPLIIFILINSGYIILKIVTEVYSILLGNTPADSLTGLLTGNGQSYNNQLIYIVLGAIFLFGYVNIVLKRLKGSLPSVIQNKKGSLSDVEK